LIPAVRTFLDFLGESIVREGLARPEMKSTRTTPERLV